jgi:hypothetical protein
MLANGALSTQAKVEGVVLKVAWLWGSDRNVINVPLGEPGHTPLYYVGRPTRWDSMGVDQIRPPSLVGELLNWEI